MKRAASVALIVCAVWLVATFELAQSDDNSPPAAAPTSAPTSAPPTSRKTRFESEYQRRTFQGSGSVQLEYRWLPPLTVKTGEKYPLVVCLHGAGGNTTASAVLAQRSMRERYPAFVMVPSAERPATWAKTDVILRGKRPADTPEILPVLIETIRSLIQTEAIDPARVYITGQSMGGVGSWGAIARYPDLFAAAVPVCGAWNVADAAKMAGVPVWAFHGADDATVPVHFSRELTAALTKAGGTAKYTEYPGVGHDSWTKAYDDAAMWKWLFAQHKAR